MYIKTEINYWLGQSREGSYSWWESTHATMNKSITVHDAEYNSNPCKTMQAFMVRRQGREEGQFWGLCRVLQNHGAEKDGGSGGKRQSVRRRLMRSNRERRKQKKRRRKGERKEGRSRLVCFLPFALTLKDMSLLMSQKALNNTADQYISPVMGFSELRLLRLVYTRAHKLAEPRGCVRTNDTAYGRLLHGWEIKGKWKNRNSPLEE